MDKVGVVPNSYCYGALIQGYCKIGNILKALVLHNEMASKGIKTNSMIVSLILQCLCKMGMASEVVDQFNNFKDLGIFLDEGKLIDALNLFEEMKEKGFKPDLVTYNVLAGGFSRNGLDQEALYLLDYMKGQGLKANTVTHNIIIEGLCIGGEVKEAEMFFNGLEDKCLDNYAAMLNGYYKAGDTTEAYELFVRLSKQGVLMKKSSCLKFSLIFVWKEKMTRHLRYLRHCWL
ncbi:hypothetical protein U1Q18_038947 [Sarracenia purpurea var. burkii]